MKQLNCYFDLPNKALSVEELMEFVNSTIDRFVPIEFRDTARVRFVEDRDDEELNYYAQMMIIYSRPYTETEQKNIEKRNESLRNQAKISLQRAATEFAKKYPEEARKILDNP